MAETEKNHSEYAGLVVDRVMVGLYAPENSHLMSLAIKEIYEPEGLKQVHDVSREGKRIVILDYGNPFTVNHKDYLSVGALIWGFNPHEFLPSEGFSLDSIAESIMLLETDQLHNPRIIWPLDLTGPKVDTSN